MIWGRYLARSREKTVAPKEKQKEGKTERKRTKGSQKEESKGNQKQAIKPVRSRGDTQDKKETAREPLLYILVLGALGAR